MDEAKVGRWLFNELATVGCANDFWCFVGYLGSSLKEWKGLNETFKNEGYDEVKGRDTLGDR
jgi:hypothetical protein